MTYKKQKIFKKESYIRIDGFSLLIGKFKLHILHILLIGISLYFFYEITRKTILRKECAQKGIILKGIVYDIQKKGSKGMKDYCYRFNFHDITYFGYDIYREKEIGDSVYIVFLPDNPNNNHMLESLEKNDLSILLKNRNYRRYLETIKKTTCPNRVDGSASIT